MYFQNNFPIIIYFKKLCRIRSTQAFLPSMWLTRTAQSFSNMGFFCLPPNLINRWVIPIKQLPANTQSSLTSFKQLQCPSCPEASFCQRKKTTTCMNQDAVSVWTLSVQFQYYWLYQEENSSNILTLKMRYKKSQWSVLNPCDHFLFCSVIKNQPNVKDNFTLWSFD